jgi:hypothetical protein
VRTSTVSVPTYRKADPRWVHGTCVGCKFTRSCNAICARVICHGTSCWRDWQISSSCWST